MEERLNGLDRRYIANIEAFHAQNGKFPDKDELKELGLPTLNTLKSRAPIVEGLLRRGIYFPRAKSELTEEQISAIMCVTNFTDRRSTPSKLRSLGITEAQWGGWLKDRNFKNALHNLSTQEFTDSLHEAQSGLMKGLNKGDTNAIKFYYEVTGRFGGDTNSQNLKMILVRLVESIQRHVKDPDIIRAISSDFDAILHGGPVGPAQSFEGLKPSDSIVPELEPQSIIEGI